MGKTKLTLIVEAKTLYDFIDPTDSDVLDNCILENQDGVKAEKGDIKEYDFLVEKEKDVRWEGDSVDDINSSLIGSDDSFAIVNDYSVSIEYIIYFPKHAEKDFFGRVVLEGKGNPKKKRVTAKVKKDGISIGDSYRYIIIFSIHPPAKLTSDFSWSGGPKTFVIDPKLQIK